MTPANKAKAIKNLKPGVGFKNKAAPTFQPSTPPKKTTNPLLTFPLPVPSPAFVTSRINKKWVLAAAPMLESNNEVPVHILSAGNVVIVKRPGVRVPGSNATWAEVEYKKPIPPEKGQTLWAEEIKTGWVDELYLDPYNDPYPDEMVKIENPTPDPRDAKQYMIWPPLDQGGKGETMSNMCGELCVAYVVQNEIDPNISLESVLRNWETAGKENPGPFSYNLGTVRGGTRDAHLENILKVYNYQPEDVRGFTDVLARNGRVDMKSLKDEIKSQYFIAQVIIESLYGSLVPKDRPGIRHWVVVEDITHNGNRVKLYNPFPNKIQEYSFAEFLASCHINLGLFIKRKTPLTFEPSTQFPLEVALDTPEPLSRPAVQYILREGGKKTNLCGEFSVAYILGKSAGNVLSQWNGQPPSKLSELAMIMKAYGCYRVKETDPRAFTIGTVLDYWRDIQPDLYRHHVIDNQTTSRRELESILTAYGYNNDDDVVGFEIGLEDPGQPVTDPAAKRLYLSPGRIANKLKTHFFIAGVGIENIGGRLKTRGETRHWVVVERMEPVGRHYQTSHYGGNGGWVQLYNPFTDVMEEYSYLEFVYSMNETGSFRGDSGFWVKRNVQLQFKDQDPLPAISDQGGEKKARQPKRPQPVVRWKREKLIDAISKKKRQFEKTGPDGKKFVLPGTAERIANQLAGSGWSRGELIGIITSLLPAPSGTSSPNNEFETELRKRLGDENTPAPPLPAEVLQVVRKESGGDVVIAEQLVDALSAVGLLVSGANGGYVKRSFPAAPDLRQSALKSYMEGLTNSQPEVNSRDGGLAVKIANAIRPLLASQAMDELKKIQPVA